MQVDGSDTAGVSDWIQIPTKKRKAADLDLNVKNAKKNAVSTDKNQFQILSNDEELRPRPIFLTPPDNIDALKKWLLAKGAKPTFSLKLEKESLKLQLETTAEFRLIQRALKAENKTFYYFQLPQEKPFKVVIKGIHTSYSEEDVKIALEELGYTILRVHRGMKITRTPIEGNPSASTKSMEPIPIVFVDLPKGDESKKIHNLDRLLHQVIKVEAPKSSKWLPQCKRCMLYGHTRNFCNMPPRCVKCLGPHGTADCNKTEEGARCVLCGGDHPANYKGCAEAKKANISKSSKSPINPPPTEEHSYSVTPPSFPPLRTKGKSYAKAATSPIPTAAHPSSTIPENSDPLIQSTLPGTWDITCTSLPSAICSVPYDVPCYV
ncbi:unnamed protein product [Bemisia tabaci]|uniref:Pre-C2HC domain-containing protein n=1 Tax=Bemisia tabaci TaxID=7038 RepID=A0A9P0EYF3_BEMTA|nr:unnamed protein product [Bemisia tabaci]